MMREISKGLAKNQETPAAACATCPPSLKQDLRPLFRNRSPCSTRSGCSPCAPRRMSNEEHAKRIQEFKNRQPRRRVYVLRVLDPNESAQNANSNLTIPAPAVDEKSGPATIKV